MFDNQKPQESFILIGVSEDSHDDIEVSLDELSELVDTAGGIVVGRMVQNLERAHPGTYFGKGKLEELRQMLWETGATGIVCDDELSPVQIRNMSQVLECVICDRTLLILDIFAAHATSREGKLQVELAQLRYRAARLVGLGKSMSRQGGGIGTRGPGEKKLEMDRRLIHERIAALKKEVLQVVQNRETQRKKRRESGMLSVALVGYTNVGKSTLLNALTGAGVLSENKLFATLDSTTRMFTLPQKEQILLTDTVGFIRKLPHDLIDAFRSTLEEAVQCDVLLHVVDASSPDYDVQMQVVKDTLRELKVPDKIMVTIFNKCDLCVAEDEEDRVTSVHPSFKDYSSDYSVCISAKTGWGFAELTDILEHICRSRNVYVERVFPYAQAGKIQWIRANGQLLLEEYQDNGILVKAYVPNGLAHILDEK